jgi:hypothetical protein
LPSTAERHEKNVAAGSGMNPSSNVDDIIVEECQQRAAQ